MSNGYIMTSDGPLPIKELYTLTGGKAIAAEKVYTLTGGIARLWYQRGTPLGTLAVGSTVKIAVGGTDYDWLVVHQGLPGSMYDASCNGTWLLMKDIYTIMKFDSRSNLFVNSSLLQYLSTTFYDAIDANVRKLIKVATIPYIDRNYTDAASSGNLRAWVFLLSMTEVGFVDTPSSHMLIEGAKLSYFNSRSKIAYFGEEAAAWWSRTPYDASKRDVWYIESNGDSAYIDVTMFYCGVRPCMILPQDALVDDTGHIIGHR